MATTNERLKTILHAAELICQQKNQSLQKFMGDRKPELLSLFSEQKAVFDQFLPESIVWKTTLAFDEGKLIGHITQIFMAGEKDLPKYQEASRLFITVLKDEVLKIKPVRSFDSLVTPLHTELNQLLVDAPAFVDERKVFFRLKGTNLNNDPAFQDISKDLRDACNLVRSQLKTLKITRSHVNQIKGFVSAIKGDTVLNNFFANIKNLTSQVNKLSALT